MSRTVRLRVSAVLLFSLTMLWCMSGTRPVMAQPTQVDSATDIDDMANKQQLRRCLRACEGGPEVIEMFCSRIRHPIIAAACWIIVYAGEPACKGFCYWYYS